MEVAGKVTVVTGAASGIGRALAQRLAEEGAAGVAVADIDADGATAVALEIERVYPGRAMSFGCDVSSDADVGELIDATTSSFGPVDLFCANAGIGGGAELPDDDSQWERAFGVNVNAHIYAARRLLPDWLERGSGYFLSTASAAGLLTQLGSAPYAVTKHAAVAFAEWLSVSYGDRGIGVSCLCPMGVQTNLLDPDREAEGAERLAAQAVLGAGALLQPEEVAEAVIAGLGKERFLILPHPEVLDFFRFKGADYDRWLGGMRRLRRQLEGGAAGQR